MLCGFEICKFTQIALMQKFKSYHEVKVWISRLSSEPTHQHIVSETFSHHHQ